MSQAKAASAPRPATMARSKVYPRQVTGRFRTLRWGINLVLQALLFMGPWIRWNGRQAIFFDLPGRNFHFFSLTFWPQETYFVLILLVFLALLLFASTAVVGRIWCGYACPQTLFTDLFLQVEHWTEGDRARRMRLDQGPWTRDKILRKAAKWSVWTGLSLWLGVTCVAWFVPGPELLARMLEGSLNPTTVGLIVFFAALALFEFGWFREQFCIYICPYARFQGAMFDRDSLVVAYDSRRGEPRGKVTDPSAGSCVDCTMCVQVCPAGIDIRHGQQMECIACSACVDACDSVMVRLNRPTGLVRYTSLNALEGSPTRVLRGRVVLYGALLLALASLFLWLLALRSPLAVDVIHQGVGGVSAATADGRISNVYAVKIMNKQGGERSLRLDLAGFPGAELVAPENPVLMLPEATRDLHVLVVHSGEDLAPVSHFQIVVTDLQDPTVRQAVPSSFLATGLGPR